MDNVSILDQIISNHKAEEVNRLNAIEILNNLFGELSKRERDILMRRYGLHGKNRETLEAVGKVHGLTRERIRQIENFSIKKLQQLKKLEDYIVVLKKVINELMEEHGGLMEKDYLLKSLVKFSADGDSSKEEEENLHKSHLDFLISKLLPDHFEEVSNSNNFKNAYKLKHQALDHLEELVGELILKIEETRKIFKTEELIEKLLNLENYNKHKEKFDIPYSLDISKVLDSPLFEEKIKVINKNKALYSLLVAARKIDQNKFGYWGIHDWREIKPKIINDKIYLVLKNHGKPMHFAEIADRINKVEFDKKKANAATVHNELILDNKYVLVGRGLYGLKEWGYKKGTVAQVIKEILEASGEPMSRDELTEKVLNKRMVKKTTITLALMDKEIFERAGGKYGLKKS